MKFPKHLGQIRTDGKIIPSRELVKWMIFMKTSKGLPIEIVKKLVTDFISGLTIRGKLKIINKK